MKKYDPKKTEENRIKNETEAKNLLSKTLKEYQINPDMLAEAIAFSSHFYNYTPTNAQLIYAQNPGATYCQSYAAWKKAGYSVLSNENGIKIWVPVRTTLLEVGKNKFVQLSKATDQQKNDYENGKIKSYEKLSFRIGYTFDISQTNYPKEKYPDLFYTGYQSDQHLAICRGIEDFAINELHCPVLQSDLKSISLRGLYDRKNNLIKINDRLEDTQRLCTTIHELGHALIHSSESARKKLPSQKEIEADALSIMLQHSYGIELTESRKMHFKEHFDKFIGQLDKTPYNGPEEAINGIFSSVFSVYKKYIESINHHVDKRLTVDQEYPVDSSKRIPLGRSIQHKSFKRNFALDR